MSTLATPRLANRNRRLPHLSLVQCLEQSLGDNRDALHEVVGYRPLFRLNGSGPLNFCEFLLALGRSPLPRALGIRHQQDVETVYDETVMRFLEMPSDPYAESGRARGHDVRRVLSAVLYKVRRRAAGRTADPILQEALAAQELQRAVVRHYVYACLEVRRSRLSGRSVYTWRVGPNQFRLLMPRWLSGPRRLAWLRAAIPDADPARPGEQERIQEVIYKRLGWGYQVDLSEVDRHAAREDSPLESLIQKELRQRKLDELIAQEKADDIESLRPTIRALGRDILLDLVRSIYQDVIADRYNQAATAQAFGLERAALNRFAGSRRKTEGGTLADLWLNTARVLASHPVFVEVLQDMGLWDQVSALLEQHPRRRRRK